MTVAVSIAAGVAALISAFPQWQEDRVALGLGFIAVIAVGNLRGLRESGRIFAVPTYFFLASLTALIAVGAIRVLTGGVSPVSAAGTPTPSGVATLSTFLVLRAFANGCTAMTGVEAVSNGVPAFKPPEARNAATTLVIMAFLCVTLFMGITLLAHAYHVVPLEESRPGYETVVSQLARGVFGGRGTLYYAVQAATMLILVLAANTAYQDFPRLASILARDRFLPRQFMNQGDRLAFSNGIVVLAMLAGMLIIVFRGDTHALIPLYMVGVFVSFTLSQGGMVVRWRRRANKAGGATPCSTWWGRAHRPGAGGRRDHEVHGRGLADRGPDPAPRPVVPVDPQALRRRGRAAHAAGLGRASRAHNTVIVPIGGVHRAVVTAVQYANAGREPGRARGLRGRGPAVTEEIRKQWAEWGQGVPLVVLDSPYRSLMEPLLEYIEQADDERPDDFVTVLLPEFVPARWWHHLLHNQRALLIKGALLFKPHIVVTSVPFHLKK